MKASFYTCYNTAKAFVDENLEELLNELDNPQKKGKLSKLAKIFTPIEKSLVTRKKLASKMVTDGAIRRIENNKFIKDSK